MPATPRLIELARHRQPRTMLIEDKLSRLQAQSARIEAGHVHLPERAPWLDDLHTELAAFARSRHDNQVYAISQFFAWHLVRMT